MPFFFRSRGEEDRTLLNLKKFKIIQSLDPLRAVGIAIDIVHGFEIEINWILGREAKLQEKWWNLEGNLSAEENNSRPTGKEKRGLFI